MGDYGRKTGAKSAQTGRKKWAKFDELGVKLKAINKAHAKRAVAIAYGIFGDAMFDDPATRIAVLSQLQVTLEYYVAMDCYIRKAK